MTARGFHKLLFLVATMLLAVAMPMAAAIGAETKPLKVPYLGPIPTGEGCFVYSGILSRRAGKLEKVNCASPEEMAKLRPPSPLPSNAISNCQDVAAQGSALPAGPCALQSTGNLGTITGTTGLTAPYNEGPPITQALIGVNLAQYSSSSDTYSGAGAYGIQLNTNSFVQSNGHAGWVQFTWGNNPGANSSHLCLWFWDTPPNSSATFKSVCGPGSKSIPLAAGTTITLGAFACYGECLPPRPFVCGDCGELPPDNPCNCRYLFTVVTSGNDVFWVVTHDYLGLSNASNWILVSGTLYGEGTPSGKAGDQLQFAGNTEVINTISATPCAVPAFQVRKGTFEPLVCPANSSAFTAETAFSSSTAEGNNLHYANGPNWANAPQSTLTCSNGICQLVAYEISPAQ